MKKLVLLKKTNGENVKCDIKDSLSVVLFKPEKTPRYKTWVQYVFYNH